MADRVSKLKGEFLFSRPAGQPKVELIRAEFLFSRTAGHPVVTRIVGEVLTTNDSITPTKKARPWLMVIS